MSERQSPSSPDEATTRREDEDGYSATALSSHWFQRPESEPGPDAETFREPEPEPEPDAETFREPDPEDAPTALLDVSTVVVTPDRVEGDVLRFGPGVTALDRKRNGADTTTAARRHGVLPARGAAPGGPPAPRRRPRRYGPAAVILLIVLAFLVWQRYGLTVAVRDVVVQNTASGPGCDGTADVVGVVRTDGRPGTFTYHWVRSDGTTSDPLREKVGRGQKAARLHLLWTFRGKGEYRATAELRITSPSGRSAATHFTYRCP